MAAIRDVRRRPMWVRVIALTLIALVLGFAMIGCYGEFPLTKLVYELNGDISDNGFIQSIVMWVFIIIPVYGIAQLGDVVIFNLIEFWTGDTVDIGAVSVDDGIYQTAINVSEDGSQMTMTVTREGDLVAELTSVEVAPGQFEMRDAQGMLVGLVNHTAAGDLELCDAQGQVLRLITAEQIATL